MLAFTLLLACTATAGALQYETYVDIIEAHDFPMRTMNHDNLLRPANVMDQDEISLSLNLDEVLDLESKSYYPDAHDPAGTCALDGVSSSAGDCNGCCRNHFYSCKNNVVNLKCAEMRRIDPAEYAKCTRRAAKGCNGVKSSCESACTDAHGANPDGNTDGMTSTAENWKGCSPGDYILALYKPACDLAGCVLMNYLCPAWKEPVGVVTCIVADLFDVMGCFCRVSNDLLTTILGASSGKARSKSGLGSGATGVAKAIIQAGISMGECLLYSMYQYVKEIFMGLIGGASSAAAIEEGHFGPTWHLATGLQALLPIDHEDRASIAATVIDVERRRRAMVAGQSRTNTNLITAYTQNALHEKYSEEGHSSDTLQKIFDMTFQAAKMDEQTLDELEQYHASEQTHNVAALELMGSGCGSCGTCKCQHTCAAKNFAASSSAVEVDLESHKYNCCYSQEGSVCDHGAAKTIFKNCDARKKCCSSSACIDCGEYGRCGSSGTSKCGACQKDCVSGSSGFLPWGGSWGVSRTCKAPKSRGACGRDDVYDAGGVFGYRSNGGSSNGGNGAALEYELIEEEIEEDFGSLDEKSVVAKATPAEHIEDHFRAYPLISEFLAGRNRSHKQASFVIADEELHEDPAVALEMKQVNLDFASANWSIVGFWKKYGGDIRDTFVEMVCCFFPCTGGTPALCSWWWHCFGDMDGTQCRDLMIRVPCWGKLVHGVLDVITTCDWKSCWAICGLSAIASALNWIVNCFNCICASALGAKCWDCRRGIIAKMMPRKLKRKLCGTKCCTYKVSPAGRTHDAGGKKIDDGEWTGPIKLCKRCKRGGSKCLPGVNAVGWSPCSILQMYCIPDAITLVEIFLRKLKNCTQGCRKAFSASDKSMSEVPPAEENKGGDCDRDTNCCNGECTPGI